MSWNRKDAYMLPLASSQTNRVAKVINQCPDLFVVLSLILDTKIAITFFCRCSRMADGERSFCAHIRTHSSFFFFRYGTIWFLSNIKRPLGKHIIYIIDWVCCILRHSFRTIFCAHNFSCKSTTTHEYWIHKNTKCERPLALIWLYDCGLYTRLHWINHFRSVCRNWADTKTPKNERWGSKRSWISETKYKYLHWKWYHWRPSDAFFWVWHSAPTKTMITSEHIHINMYYVVAYTSRGNCQSEIDLMFSVHVRNVFTKSLLFGNSWSFWMTTPSLLHTNFRSFPFMWYFAHCQPFRSLNLLWRHLSWWFCLTEAFFLVE